MAYESKQAAPTDSLCARPLQRTAAHILVICAFWSGIKTVTFYKKRHRNKIVDCKAE